jgi:hypothetical protein
MLFPLPHFTNFDHFSCIPRATQIEINIFRASCCAAALKVV